LQIDLVQTSCGFAVPYYEFTGDRNTLTDWAARQGEQSIQQYWQKNNLTSLNGKSTGITVKK
ncbi:MAG TPA: pyridoxamine 5'-phosphate oxidase family protein, partial [Gammaproteobacteria bacterium]|nr:pyridoxamine 5'-phosphate oxidase family protein [Gammaproteobacteria bacterium]